MLDLRRRQLISLLGAAAAWPLAVRAQQSKTPRIGVLSTQSADPRTDAFKQGLRELGYIEGQTIAIEWRFSGDRTERLADFAAELVRSDVDLIVATSSLPAHAAKSATSTIPIVFVAVSDPVEFVSLRRLPTREEISRASRTATSSSPESVSKFCVKFCPG
jgi:putative ABC transport system substrate-binding protein